MRPVPLLSGFGNLVGLDGIVILLVQAGIVVSVILLVRMLAGKKDANSPASSVRERLRVLESMRRARTITDEEYVEQRRRILAEL